MMSKVEEKGPQDVLNILNVMDDEQDRMGYWADIVIMCTFLTSMVNTWSNWLRGTAMDNATEEEMKSVFSALRNICGKMVYETEAFHQAISPPRFEDEEKDDEERTSALV